MSTVQTLSELETDGLRRCAVRRERGDRATMIRFVVGPEGEIVPDLTARLPGRGIWVSADRAAIDDPGVRQAFARAAKAPVRVPGGLGDRIEQALASRCVDLVGLARRAGQLVMGFDQVDEALRSEALALLLVAADAASGRDRLYRGGQGPQRIDWLSRDELGRAVGRDELVYAAVRGGGIASKLAVEAQRLKGLRRPVAVDAMSDHPVGSRGSEKQ